MSKSDAFKYKNRYGYKGLVVLKFENFEVDGKPQIYATGFDLDNPTQKISVALMQEEGYRKNIAQTDFGIVEKTDGDQTRYFNQRAGVEIDSKTYNDFLENNIGVDSKFNKIVSQRSKAENLLTKKNRATLPAVLMFDNANKLGTIGDIAVYEARWVSGISGNNPKPDFEKEVDKTFNVMHRKVLGNVSIKYDGERAYWGDINAVDRITTLETPKPNQTPDEIQEISLRNRDLLRYALHNQVKSADGYKAERKPFTCFNILDSKGEHQETVRLYAEEFLDGRYKEGDPTQKMKFMRPKDAPETLHAYLYHQDKFSKPLKDLIESGEPIELKDKDLISKAIRSDKARAVISSLVNTPFTPLVTKDLAERSSNPDMQRFIAIEANKLNGFYKKMVLGELQPRLVSGTTYAIGPKYLERFVNEIQLTNEGRSRPLRGIVHTEPFNNPNNTPMQHRDKIYGHTPDNKLIFSEMYICPALFDAKAEFSSVYTGLVTIPHQSYKQAEKSRVLHTDLTEEHAPKLDSFRFIEHEYKDYTNGTLEAPSVVKLLNEEKDRIATIDNEKDSKVAYDTYYRLLGTHKTHEPEQAKPVENRQKSEMKKEEDLSFGL